MHAQSPKRRRTPSNTWKECVAKNNNNARHAAATVIDEVIIMMGALIRTVLDLLVINLRLANGDATGLSHSQP
jgi:hypothetical protein